jgi:methylmalonyl-CoA mutase
VIQEESGITKVVDPYGGSFYVENLTQELAERAWNLIIEIEELGGMANAIETGLPKTRIEEAAAKKQARIDSGRDIIVGVNRFRLPHEQPLDVLTIDNTVVRERQAARLASLRSGRDAAAVDGALEALRQAAKTGEGNLLALSVEAARVRATLGEISDALETSFGRYQAVVSSSPGVYVKEVGETADIAKARELADAFAAKEGRRPRILIAKMGQDGHDRGQKAAAAAYADLGFDVDLGPLFQTPEEVARQAADNDVHVLGVSSLAAGHKTLVPQVIEELAKLGREDIAVVVGGVIPHQDYEFLFDSGVVGIFGPGTSLPQAAQQILTALMNEEVGA